MAGVHSVRDKLRLRDTSGHFKTIESYNFQYHCMDCPAGNQLFLLLLDVCFTGLVWFMRSNIELKGM